MVFANTMRMNRQLVWLPMYVIYVSAGMHARMSPNEVDNNILLYTARLCRKNKNTEHCISIEISNLVCVFHEWWTVFRKTTQNVDVQAITIHDASLWIQCQNEFWPTRWWVINYYTHGICYNIIITAMQSC